MSSPEEVGSAKTWRIVIKSSAAKELAALDSKLDRQRIVAAIASLADNPRPHGCEKLSGQLDLYRLRSGNFRVIYEIIDDELLVTVVKVGHRRSIYLKL